MDIFNLTTSSVLVCCALGILQIFSVCAVDILRTLCVVDKHKECSKTCRQTRASQTSQMDTGASLAVVADD